MLRDPDIRCVLMARGGYGAMRIATDVDWGAMRRDPKIFAGYSDATFLHLGFQARSGVAHAARSEPARAGLQTPRGDRSLAQVALGSASRAGYSRAGGAALARGARRKPCREG